MEVSFVIAFEFLLWLAGVHTLQDAEAAEVLQRDLHIANGIRARLVLTGFSFHASFDFPHLFINFNTSVGQARTTNSQPLTLKVN